MDDGATREEVLMDVMNDQQADSLLRHQRDKFQGAKSAIDSILPAVESLPPPVQRKP